MDRARISGGRGQCEPGVSARTRPQMVRAAAQSSLNLILTNRGGGSFTSQEIQNEVERMAEAFRAGGEVDQEAIVAELEELFQTIIGIARVLRGDDEGYEPWLAGRAGHAWPFWDRYEQYLLEEVGWPHATLNRLDESTDQILDLLTDPGKEGAWDRRGLVVGHVQSGKFSGNLHP